MSSTIHRIYVLLSLVVFLHEAGEYLLLMRSARICLGAINKLRDRGSCQQKARVSLFHLPFYFIFFCLVELQITFTALPPNPFPVLEGNNISLEWSYDLGGGSFTRVEFELDTSPPGFIVEVRTIGQSPSSVGSDYTNRVQVNVTATQTAITILEAKRITDSGIYLLRVVSSNNRAFNSLRISVQCK